MAIPFLNGIDVTGTVDLSNLTIDGAQGTDGQVLTSTGLGIAWEDASGGASLSGGEASKVAVWSATDTLTHHDNFHFDTTNVRLGIGDSNPNRTLVVSETRTGSTASDAYTAIVKSVQSSGASPNPGTGGLKVQYTSSSSNVHAFGLVAGSSSSDFLTTGPMHFYTNSDLDTVSATGFAMQLDTSQRLIIGSTTATQKLNVDGNVKANRYYGHSSTTYYVDPDDGTASAILNGAVAIGDNATPAHKLVVRTPAGYGDGADGIFIKSSFAGSSPVVSDKDPFLSIGCADSSSAVSTIFMGQDATATSQETKIEYSHDNDALSIYKSQMGAYREHVRFGNINSTATARTRFYGNVGIGVNPTEKLHVNGDFLVNNTSGAANGSAHEIARLINTTSGATSSYMYIGASTGNDWRVGKNILGTSGVDNFGIAKHSGSTLALEIDGSSNVISSVSSRAPIFYDLDNTSYYVNPAGLSYINEIRSNEAQANPRYDTAFYVLQAQHWYGDTSSQTMYIGESGNDVLIRGQVAIGGTAIQSGYALTMTGHIDLNNSEINYVSQLHFNDNVRFYDEGNDSYLNYKYGDASTGGIKFVNGGGTTKGYIYAEGSGFGLLDNDGHWAVRTQTGSNPLILYTNNNAEFYVYESFTQSPGSSRAPIFYDSNNTSYYVDPASTSIVNTVTANDALQAFHIGIRNSSSSTKDGISLYNGAVGGEPTYGLMFTGTSGSGTHGGVTGDWATYFTMNNDSSRGWIFRKAGITNSASISAGGVATFDTSVNSPIFYDSNDTNYYVDPHSTSQVNNVTMNGELILDSAGGTTKFIAGSADRADFVGQNVVLSGWNGLGFYNPTSGGTYANQTTAFYNFRDGIFSVKGSHRAPIFYDSNDTTYYVDPSTSGTSAYLRGNILINKANSTGTAIEINSVRDSSWAFEFTTNDVGNDNWSGFWVGSNGYPDMRLRREGSTVNALISSWERSYTTHGLTDSTDMRAPIFYDSTSTSYYLDPNSSGVSLHINGIIDQDFQVTDLNSAWTAPGTSRDQGFIFGRFQNGVSNAPATNDNANWFANIYSHPSGGTASYGVQLAGGNNDNQAFYLRRFSNGSAGSWRRIFHEGSSDVRAPIFYDSNNTAYYTDPSNVSVLSRVVAGTTSTSNSGSTLHVTGTATSSNPYVHFNGSNGGNYGGIGVRFNNIAYGAGAEFVRSSPYDASAIQFKYQSSTVGRITIGTTSTAYLTTSDYRLKENVIELTGGIERVKQLQPKRFNFIGDEKTVDGFIAHEAEEIVPESVNGEKDEVLPNGEPVYQGIDQAKLVPLLTAALKEAIAKIEDLETRVQSLENQ